MNVTIQNIKSAKAHVHKNMNGIFYTVDITEKKGGEVTLFSDDLYAFIEMFLDCANQLMKLENKEVEG